MRTVLVHANGALALLMRQSCAYKHVHKQASFSKLMYLNIIYGIKPLCRSGIYIAY